MSSKEPETIDDELADKAGELILETEEAYQEQKAKQHDLLDAVAEEDGAPLLETKCDIHGITVPVSGRLTGEFVERVESLDAEAKRRADGESEQTGVSDIVRELAEIVADLIDDPELTASGVYRTYQEEGVMPVRTILESVMESLQKEEERMRGTADGFRSKPDGA